MAEPEPEASESSHRDDFFVEGFYYLTTEKGFL